MQMVGRRASLLDERLFLDGETRESGDHTRGRHASSQMPATAPAVYAW